MRTVIGLFRDSIEAKETIADLQKLGARAQDISVVAPAGTSPMGGGLQLAPFEVPGLGRVAACGPVSTYLTQTTPQGSTEGIISAIVEMGVSDAEARRYVDFVRDGYTLEAVDIEDAKANEALAIMREHSVSRTEDRSRDAARAEGDSVFPVIVEELDIGKREVKTGGVRATSRVKEIPAEQEVTLREERIDVERRAVDRPLGEEGDAFRERTVEVVATSEEPVITKRARVIEEVVIHHDVKSKTETVHDTVRRTDVEVEPFDASHFKEHFESQYARSNEGEDFSSYRPAYELGSEMRTDTRFSGKEWESVEPHAKRTWETRNPGTWDRFKDAVKHAWEQAKGK
jgi:uncharacterized protein (TIGR02271 family)